MRRVQGRAGTLPPLGFAGVPQPKPTKEETRQRDTASRLHQFESLWGIRERLDGWNVWLTFVISPAAAMPPSSMRMVAK
jgi:hypothetical protein